MAENRYESGWLTLQNPFSRITKQVTLASIMERNIDTSDAIIGRVSGRRADITRIIMNEQSAIFLVGTPHIGKSTLIRYLQQPSSTGWSWRNELVDLGNQLKLDDIHFVQIDLAPLEGIEGSDELLSSFIGQCTKAFYSAYQQEERPLSSQSDLKELRGLLRTISREAPGARYFVMLDSIERLGMTSKQPRLLDGSKAQTFQERGLALLDHCNAIRTLVELIDEFTAFGVILSVESLPRPRIDDQFQHVSLDLARFTTMILQAFTWDDTAEFLAQGPENFGTNWASMFKTLGGNYIFSRSEQAWLRQQAGTHPYLLQQLCFHMFRFKQEYASIHSTWPELQAREKLQLIELINENLSTFLAHTWQRLQEALENNSQETKSKFYEFISSLAYKQADNEIDPTDWYELGPELRYIVSSPTTGHSLTIGRPGDQPVLVSLSELEYRLFKTLLQRPERCKEDELMQGAWGRLIEKPRFTQRMHQLRKKLKEQGVGTEIIENSYGGFYSLNHPEWLHLE